MEARYPGQKITGYGLRLLYAFSLAFYLLNLVFSVIYMLFVDIAGFYNAHFLFPWLTDSQQSLIIALTFLTVLLVVIAGILLLIYKNMAGAYLFYMGNLVLIVLFVLRSEPDWYSSILVVAVSALFLIPVRIIGNHSKLGPGVEENLS